MDTIKKGLFFLDYQAQRDFKKKAKYFIVFTDGDLLDDELVCFSLNTEHRMDLYRILCNKNKAKFILSSSVHKFSFLTEFSTLMLNEPCIYRVEELFSDRFEVFENDIASIELLRQIRNCIDDGYLLPKHILLIKNSFSQR